MTLTCGQHSLESRRMATESELQKMLEDVEGAVMLGQPSEFKEAFYFVHVTSGPPANRQLHLGIRQDEVGLEPAILLVPESSLVVAGFGESVAGIELGSSSVAFTLDLPHQFYRFLVLPRFLVVVHEIGLTAVNFMGQILWSHDAGDIVLDATLTESSIQLLLYDGHDVRVSLSDGKKLA